VGNSRLAKVQARSCRRKSPAKVRSCVWQFFFDVQSI
jgi:hypothetical protein